MRRTKTRMTAALLGAALGAASLIATAAPAQAAWSQCPQDYSCYWSQVGGTGSFWQAPSCGRHTVPFTVVSLWNRGHGTIYFEGSGYSAPVGYQGSNGALAYRGINIAC